MSKFWYMLTCFLSKGSITWCLSYLDWKRGKPLACFCPKVEKSPCQNLQKKKSVKKQFLISMIKTKCIRDQKPVPRGGITHSVSLTCCSVKPGKGLCTSIHIPHFRGSWVLTGSYAEHSVKLLLGTGPCWTSCLKGPSEVKMWTNAQSHNQNSKHRMGTQS